MLLHGLVSPKRSRLRGLVAAIVLSATTLAAAIAPAIAQPKYTLTQSERQAYGGTFGINFSHFDFDRDADNPRCKRYPDYDTPACSCSIDWRKVKESGLSFAYLKATEGIRRDLSFPRNWDALLAEHKAERIYRGAYHFLRPVGSAREQAATFLQAIGAVNGKRPTQIAPVLDIEWSKAVVERGSTEETACPASFKSEERGVVKCDMWHTRTSQQIVGLVADWIDIVEKATGRQVTIYTNKSWWDRVIAGAGAELMRDQPVWISRYFGTPSGPKFNPDWTAEGGSGQWGMPPLPRGARYPARSYTTPHFWQFAEEARIAEPVYICHGTATAKDAELNWVPATRTDLDGLFGAP